MGKVIEMKKDPAYWYLFTTVALGTLILLVLIFE